MLSILIPTYNYDITKLVKELVKQCNTCKIHFEILVYNDGSKSDINLKNKTINSIQNCIFVELPENIGRSAIRNLMGTNANYDHLLFLDADVLPYNKNFIENYFRNLISPVVFGGLTYTKDIPKKPNKLRWLYTKKRESIKGIHASNFLIKKSVFLLYPFDINLTKYGYEDVLFFNLLTEKNIKIKKINNPVIHYGNDDATTFLIKTEQGIKNLIFLTNRNSIRKENYKIIKVYDFLKKLKIDEVISFIFKISKPLLKKNFNSNYPSIFLYDFYRLGYFCLIKTKQ